MKGKTLECCSRCEKKITTYWEDNWPNYGHIHLGISGQSERVLTKHAKTKYPYQDHTKGCKAFTKSDPQELIIEWGSGYKYESRERYRLCCNCQVELVEILGDFFKYGV